MVGGCHDALREKSIRSAVRLGERDSGQGQQIDRAAPEIPETK